MKKLFYFSLFIMVIYIIGFNYVFAIENGFIEEDSKTYYYVDGEKATGVQQIDDKYYLFNEEGILQYGVTDGIYYYGSRQYNYWWDKELDGKKDSYFDSDGVIATGVQQIEGQYYNFDSNGILQYGVTDGTYYYGRYSGTRQNNYLWDINQDGVIDNYFGSDGKKVSEYWLDENKDGKDDYYFDSDGNAR